MNLLKEFNGYCTVSATVAIEGFLISGFAVSFVERFVSEDGTLKPKTLLQLTIEFPPSKHDVLGISDCDVVAIL